MPRPAQRLFAIVVIQENMFPQNKRTEQGNKYAAVFLATTSVISSEFSSSISLLIKLS